MTTYKTLLSFLSLLLALASYAQSDTAAYKHEVGINISPFSYGGYFIPGVIYRYHFKQYSYRARLDAALNSSSSRDKTQRTETSIPNSDYTNKSSGKSIGLSLGVQKNVAIKNAQFYYGLDALIQFSNSKNAVEATDGTYSNANTVNSVAFGVSPLLGFQFMLNSRISLAAEMAVTGTLFKNNTRSNYSEFTNLDRNYTESGSRFYFTPLNALLISYHF